MWWMEFGKINNCSITLKISLEIESFDIQDLQRMKFEQNPEILSRVEIWLKMRFLTTQDLRKIKIWQKSEFLTCIVNLFQNWIFLTTPEFSRRLQKILVALKLWFKSDIFDHSRQVMDGNWRNKQFFNHIENLARNWEFWHSRPAKDEIWTKSRNFEPCWKFGSKWDFLLLTACLGAKIQKFWHLLLICLKIVN